MARFGEFLDSIGYVDYDMFWEDADRDGYENLYFFMFDEWPPNGTLTSAGRVQLRHFMRYVATEVDIWLESMINNITLDLVATSVLEGLERDASINSMEAWVSRVFNLSSEDQAIITIRGGERRAETRSQTEEWLRGQQMKLRATMWFLTDVETGKSLYMKKDSIRRFYRIYGKEPGREKRRRKKVDEMLEEYQILKRDRTLYEKRLEKCEKEVQELRQNLEELRKMLRDFA